jgi:plastocyanin
MSNETLFYVCGIVLAVSAVTVSFVGLKLRDFPGKALPLVLLWFVVFVGAATTFAVLHAQDEEKAKAAELEKAGKEVEKDETSGPFEGAEGGESAAGEEPEGGAEEEPAGEAENKADKGGSEVGAGSTLRVEASPTALAFDTTHLTAKAGEVTIAFKNPSAIPHDVEIEANGKQLGGTEEVAESEESATLNLKPGTYTFYCSVPGHRQAGMEGTLVVR